METRQLQALNLRPTNLYGKSVRPTPLRSQTATSLDSVVMGSQDSGIYSEKMFRQDRSPANNAFQAASSRLPGLSRQGWNNYSALGSSGSGLGLREIDGLLADPGLSAQHRELLQLDRLTRFGEASPSANPLNAAERSQALAKMNGGIWETVVETARSIHNQITKIIGAVGSIAEKVGGKRGGIIANVANGLNSFSYGIQALLEGDWSKAYKSFANGMSSVTGALSEVLKKTPKGSWVKWVPGLSAVSDGVDVYNYSKKSTDANKRGDEFGGACYGIAACLASLSGVLNLTSLVPGAGAAISGLAKGTGALAAGAVVLAEMVD